MEKYEMCDIIMPNQDRLLSYYRGNKGEVDKQIFEKCCQYSRILDINNEGFEFPSEFPAQQYMGTDPFTRKLQCMLLKMINAKNVLEIGTFVGVSTVSFAKTIGKNGHIWTIEKYDKFAKLARRNFEYFGANNITLLEGEAKDNIQKAIALSSGRGGIDFVFLDGDKENYKEYFKMVWGALNIGGIVMLDDGLFEGDVINSTIITSKGGGVKKMLEFVGEVEDANSLLLPLGAGVFIVMKEKNNG